MKPRLAPHSRDSGTLPKVIFAHSPIPLPMGTAAEKPRAALSFETPRVVLGGCSWGGVVKSDPVSRGWQDTWEELTLGAQRGVGRARSAGLRGPRTQAEGRGGRRSGAWMSSGGSPGVVRAWEAVGHRLCEFGGRRIRKH